MPGRDFNFPLATLTKQATRLQDALTDPTYGPPVLARLPANFPAGFTSLLGKVAGAPAGKASQMGTTATLTGAQDAALHEMLRLMAAARRSAALAFKGNNVVLRQEFKVGEHEPQTLAAELDRAKVIVASAQKYATELGEHGWTAADATELATAISTFGSADLEQEAKKDEGPAITAAANADASQLYKNCLSIQNAARLQYPSTKPGHEAARARYLLGEFPPHGHSESGPTPPPPAPPTPPAAPKP